MDNKKSINPDDFITVIVENTNDIEAWLPILSKIVKSDNSIIEVYSALAYNDDFTKIKKAREPMYSIQIATNVEVFNEYLDFFAERTNENDIISVWKSVEELNELIDEKAEE